jgi:CHAT domain-containing protein
MLYRVAEKSFILVHSDQEARQAGVLIHNLRPVHRGGPAHVIVARYTLEEECYYLFTREQASALLPTGESHAGVLEALDLDRMEPVPILSAYASEFDVPPIAVVVEGGYVLGFIDNTIPAAALSGTRWNTRGGFESFTAVERALVTDFPRSVPLGETCSLLLFLSADLTAGLLSISVPLHSTVDVIVQARQGFELVGPREGSLVVTDEKETMPLQFKFEATRAGVGVIRIYLFRQGQSLGSMELEAQVTADEAKVNPPVRVEQQLPSVQVLAPDLTLIINEQRGPGERSMVFELRTREEIAGPKVRQQFGPVRLALDPQQYFREFFKDIDALPLTETEAYLATNGSDLSEALFPEPLRNLLWSLRDRIQSVQVQSEEPWIPWELCRLQGRENGRIKSGPFLCEAYQVTRWLPQLTAKTALKLSKIALVVPQDSGLKAAPRERNYMLSLNKAGRQVDLIPATKAEVVRALSSGEYDGWHFSCHGSLDPERPNLSWLGLEKKDTLMPVDLTGENENLGLAQPLVFLNACQAGQGTLALSGAGGWAERFLKAAWSEEYPSYGAAAFVGAYWSIDDISAHAFAVAFYDRIFSRMTIGEAVQKARLAVRGQDDPTWLAYTVFAHPLAKVQ